MRNNNVKKVSSWEKIRNDDIKYIGRKNVDYNTFNGFRINIPLSYQSKFLKNIYTEQNRREKLKVKILCDDKVFNAILMLPVRGVGNKSISLIYNKDLQLFLRKKLYKSYTYITNYYNKFSKKLFNIPRKYAEHIDFYVGESSNTFLIKLISREQVEPKENQKSLKSLNDFKEKMDLEYEELKSKIETLFNSINGTINNEVKNDKRLSEEERRWRLGVKGDSQFKSTKYNYIRNSELTREEEHMMEKQFEELDNGKFISKVNKLVNLLKEIYARGLYEHIFKINDINEEVAYKELEKELLSIKTKMYEKEINSRKECLNKYGCTCSCCGINLGDVYGKDFERNIELHCINSEGGIEEEYKLNLCKDLRPLCPNCHSIIHSKIPAYTIEELRARISKNKCNLSRISALKLYDF